MSEDTGTRAVILAGGKGTRLAPYTTILPKPLMPLGEYPILEILIRQLRYYGITQITVAAGYLSHLIRAYFEDGTRFGVHIDYSLEETPLGTAGPISLISDLDQTFLVMNGDLLTTLDYRKLIEHHRKSEALLTIPLHTVEYQLPLGYVECNGENVITNYVEKPTHRYAVSMGLYVLEPAVLEYLEPNQYLDIPELVARLIENREPVIGYPTDAFWLDIGRQEEYQRALAMFDELKGELLRG